MSIARISDLSPEAQNIEARAIGQVKQRLDALIEEYRQRFGVVVGTDLARELFPDYTASLESRLTFAVAVQRSAAHIADEVFTRILSEPCTGDALFTAGGTGARQDDGYSDQHADPGPHRKRRHYLRQQLQ